MNLRASYNAANKTDPAPHIIPDMNLRASYNRGRVRPNRNIIIPDMNLRASYNRYQASLYFPHYYTRYEFESKL